jgi:hypothetical protein
MNVMWEFAAMLSRRDEADEGVVERVEDQRGDRDAVEDPRGGGAVVVVVRGLEAGVERGDAVVEVAQGADVGATLRVEDVREEYGFAAEAAQERAEKSPLVETVLPMVETIGGGLEIDRGRDADDATQLRRCVGAEVAGEFEHQVSAHRVANERDGLQLLRSQEEVQHAVDVPGQAGVVERRREALGAAAVAHVHADHVATGAPQLVGVADDVLRARRAFETVENDDRGSVGTLR